MVRSIYSLDELEPSIFNGSGDVPPPDPSPDYITVATEIGTGPVVHALQLTGGQNAFRIWVGETPVAEPDFTLYVSRNDSSAVSVRVSRWDAPIIYCQPNDVFAFGTEDGRTIHVTPTIQTGSLNEPGAVSGTVLCDDGCPPFYVPVDPHITLAEYYQTIRITEPASTDQWLFISEFHGQGGDGWTETRWVWLPADATIDIECTYKDIAIATIGGATVDVSCPPDAEIAIVGGRSMILPTYPEFYNTEYNCIDQAQFEIAITQAIAGDRITLDPAGSPYTFSAGITESSFTANNNHTHDGILRAGMEGISIEGTGASMYDVVITGDGLSDTSWNIKQPGATSYSGFKNLSFNFSGIPMVLYCRAGKWALWDIDIDGETTVTNSASHSFQVLVEGDLQYDALNVTVRNAANDGWDGSGDAAHNATSRVRLVNCIGGNTGPDVNDQCLTSHDGLPVEVYGGQYFDAQLNVVANSTGTTDLWAFFTRFDAPGGRSAGFKNATGLFGCLYNGNVTSNTSLNRPGAYVLFNRMIVDDYMGTTSLGNSSNSANSRYCSDGTFSHNYLISTSNAGRAYFPQVGDSGLFIGNIISGFGEGIRVANYSAGDISTIRCIGNTFNGLARATLSDATLPCDFRNNASNGGGTFVTGGTATPTGDYNTYRSSSAYTPGTDDMPGTAAEIGHDTWFADAGGNCDANGFQGVYGYIGGRDAFGFVHQYNLDTTDRGARNKPIVYDPTLATEGMVMYPHYWQAI